MLATFFRAKRSNVNQIKAKQKRLLSIECLEDRTCPSTGDITGFSAVVLPGHLVELSGHAVKNGNQQEIVVNFGGAVSNAVSTTTDTNGNFDITTSQANLGVATAVAVIDGVSGSPATATIAVDAPVVTLTSTSGTASSVVLNGTVAGIDQTGQTVSISGVAEGTSLMLEIKNTPWQ